MMWLRSWNGWGNIRELNEYAVYNKRDRICAYPPIIRRKLSHMNVSEPLSGNASSAIMCHINRCGGVYMNKAAKKITILNITDFFS